MFKDRNAKHHYYYIALEDCSDIIKTLNMKIKLLIIKELINIFPPEWVLLSYAQSAERGNELQNENEIS